MPKWLYNLLRRTSQTSDVYVDPLEFRRTFDDDWAEAIVERKQRLQSQILKNRGMSLLVGYKPPEPYNADRIEAQAHKAGVVMPTDRRQQGFLEPWAVNSIVQQTHKKTVYPIRLAVPASAPPKPE